MKRPGFFSLFLSEINKYLKVLFYLKKPYLTPSSLAKIQTTKAVDLKVGTLIK